MTPPPAPGTSSSPGAAPPSSPASVSGPAASGAAASGAAANGPRRIGPRRLLALGLAVAVTSPLAVVMTPGRGTAAVVGQDAAGAGRVAPVEAATPSAATSAGTGTARLVMAAAPGTARAAHGLGVAARPAGAGDLAGYWMVDQRGHVHAFGGASHAGEGRWGTVAVAATPDGTGYWLVTDRGVIVPRGGAGDLGGTLPLRAGERVVGLTATASGRGAWLFTSRGAVHARGDAPAWGDASRLPLVRPMVGGAATPGGRGFWMVAADGGVFSFGDADFHGSMGGRPLNAPVVAIVPTPTGGGYWLVATDGGVFSFGDADFHGSMGGVPLNQPVRGMVAAGQGYLMVAADGGVFTFGPGVPFHGSLGGSPPADPVVAIAPVPPGGRALSGPVRLQPYRWSVEPVDPARLTASWRPGCPVGPADLRLVTVDHWDFGGRLRSGELVVHRDVAAAVAGVFERLHQARFPIGSLELVDRFGGDDGRSMAAGNSSAFNCRAVTGGTTWSEHSYGRAIDLNPVQNPYVRGSTVLPAAGRAHLDRNPATPGLIRGGDPVVRAFAEIGWAWGGHWSSPDHQHFSASGR